MATSMAINVETSATQRVTDELEESDSSDEGFEPEVKRDVEIMHLENTHDNQKKLFENCKKNSGHANFIKVTEFKLHHIPHPWRLKSVLRIIRRYSAFTVKLTVKYTSTNRPDKFGIIDGIDYRGCRTHITGSGRIYAYGSLWGPVKQEYTQDCPLQNCPIGSQPHKVSPTFYVYTAAHVVYDDEEARNTDIEIVVDNIPVDDPNSTILCQGVAVTFVTVKNDACYFKCITHELDKLNIIKDLSDSKIYGSPEEEEEESKLTPMPPNESLTFIISFPHGAEKHITMGTRMATSTKTATKSFTLLDIYNIFGEYRYENLDSESREMALKKIHFQYHSMKDKFESNADQPIKVSKMIERLGGGLEGKDLERQGPEMLKMSIYTDQFQEEFNKVVNLLEGTPCEKIWFCGAISMLVTFLEDFCQTIQEIHYSADTCPGSSGGPVFVFLPDERSNRFKVIVAPHSHKSPKYTAYNVSGIGAMWYSKQTKFPIDLE